MSLMLSSYKNAADTAGNTKRVAAGSVADAMRQVGNAYGPSQHAFESWKRSGIPTAETMQGSTFGMATRKGDTAGDALAGKPSVPVPLSAPPSMNTAPRPNPITWLGGPPEPAPRRHVDAITGRPMMPVSHEPAPPPPPQVNFQPLSQDEMQQTWSSLMRTGKVRASAAQCMVDMPPEYSMEPPPPRPPVNSQAINTIGLHPQQGGRPVKRSTAFTSDFRDPFL